MALGHEEPAALAARGAAVAAGHVGGGRRFVEEDELVGVEVRLSREPRPFMDGPPLTGLRC